MRHGQKLALFLSLTVVLAGQAGCGRVKVTPPPEPSPSASAAPSDKPTVAPTTAPTTAPTSAPTGAPTTAPTTAPTAKPTGLLSWNQLPVVAVPPKQPANPDPLTPPPDPSTLPNQGGTLPGGGANAAGAFKAAADGAAAKWQPDAYLAQVMGADLVSTGKTQAKTGSYWGFLYYSAKSNQMLSVIALGQGGMTTYAQNNPFGSQTPFYLAKLTPWKVDSAAAMATAVANGYKPFTDYATITLHMLQNAPVWQADGEMSVRINAVTGAFMGKALQGNWK